MKAQVKAFFQDFNAGTKKDAFEVKGDLTGEQTVAFHKLKGSHSYLHWFTVPEEPTNRREKNRSRGAVRG